MQRHARVSVYLVKCKNALRKGSQRNSMSGTYLLSGDDMLRYKSRHHWVRSLSCKTQYYVLK